MKNFTAFVVLAFFGLFATFVFGSFIETDKTDKTAWSLFVSDVATREKEFSKCLLRFVLHSNDSREKNLIMKALLSISLR